MLAEAMRAIFIATPLFLQPKLFRAWGTELGEDWVQTKLWYSHGDAFTIPEWKILSVLYFF